MPADPLARLFQQIAGAHSQTAEAESRRRHGRLPLEFLQCNLGQVINMSAGGICVRGSVTPQGTTEVTFADHPLPETLTGRVVWKKEIDEESWLFGLEWVDLSKILATELTIIATAYRDRMGLTLADQGDADRNS